MEADHSHSASFFQERWGVPEQDCECIEFSVHRYAHCLEHLREHALCTEFAYELDASAQFFGRLRFPLCDTERKRPCLAHFPVTEENSLHFLRGTPRYERSCCLTGLPVKPQIERRILPERKSPFRIVVMRRAHAQVSKNDITVRESHIRKLTKIAMFECFSPRERLQALPCLRKILTVRIDGDDVPLLPNRTEERRAVPTQPHRGIQYRLPFPWGKTLENLSE